MELIEPGIALRRPYLHSRQVTPYSEVAHLPPNQAAVKLVDLDTSKQGGTIYENILTDPEKGVQKIRVVRTTKPYNPNFITSAQTLIYILPENIDNCIVTPLDSTKTTWMRFLRMNRAAIEAMIETYHSRGLKDFRIFTGIGFSPYSNKDYLKIQSVKAVHIHGFLLSDQLLQKVDTFSSRAELRTIHQTGSLTKPLDINRDIRRFFPGSIYRAFATAAGAFILDDLTKIDLDPFGQASIIPEHKGGRFPIGGIEFTAKSLSTLESEQFYRIIRTSYKSMDTFYKDFLMPIFSPNYEEVIAEIYPDSAHLQFNSTERALAIFDEKINHALFSRIPDEQKSRWRSIIRRTSSRLNTAKPEVFSLGPGLSVTARFIPGSEDVNIYLTYSPFGGGTIESIGINKIPISSQEQEELFSNFYSDESMQAQEELETTIKIKLRTALQENSN